MAVDELSVVLKARELINEVDPTAIPVTIEAYLKHIGATLRVDHDLGVDEAGYTVEIKGKRYVNVNGKDSEERRRFTACHEAAHIRLGLPSEHAESSWWSYDKR